MAVTRQMDYLLDMEEEDLFRRLLASVFRPRTPIVPDREKELILRGCLAGHEPLMKDFIFEYPVYNN
jgi:hypothetical protein